MVVSRLKKTLLITANTGYLLCTWMERVNGLLCLFFKWYNHIPDNFFVTVNAVKSTCEGCSYCSVIVNINLSILSLQKILLFLI